MDLFELLATLGIDTNPFITGLGDALQWAMRSLVDFGHDVLDTGMGFDEEMSAVQAVLGTTEATVENMEKLRSYALDQARGSIFTAEEVAQAYYYMGMAGWKTEEMLAGLNPVISLAAASGEDLAMVSDIVTDSLTAFGLTANDAGHYVDILAQTATNSNTDVRRMGETFKYVAPIAGALGFDVEDVALSIGLLASAGIKGSQAGTTLRNIFTRISTNAGATSKDLGALEIVTDKLGVSFYDAEGKARDWGEVLTEMRTAWRGLNEEQRLVVADAFNGFIESGQDASATLNDFKADVETVQNLFQQMNSTKVGSVYEDLKQQIGEIGQQYDELLNMLGVPIPKEISGYADALDQARIKLGLMSDQEKIYYSKQISSMRGMSGFLRLLEAEDADLKQLVESYENAAGAAQAMAGIRLDNLAGDVKLLNASLDVLEYAIFDDIKAPMRDVVQYATNALNRITDEINKNGLIGGIRQLGTEIRDFSEEYGDEIEEFINSLLPILTAVITDLAPAFIEAATTIGKSLAHGLLIGLSEVLNTSDVPILKWLGSGLADAAEGLTYWWNTDMSGGTGGWQGAGTGFGSAKSENWTTQEAIEYAAIVGITAEDVQTALDTAGDNATLTINDIEWSTDLWADFLLALQGAGVESELSSEIGAAGSSGGAMAASNIQSVLSSTPFYVNVYGNYMGTNFGSGTGTTSGGGGSNINNAQPLHQMIQDGISTAMKGVVDEIDTMAKNVANYSPKIYLDSGALVGGIAGGMNSELNSIAKWKGFGRV